MVKLLGPLLVLLCLPIQPAKANQYWLLEYVANGQTIQGYFSTYNECNDAAKLAEKAGFYVSRWCIDSLSGTI